MLVNAKDFTYNKESRVFIADASDIGILAAMPVPRSIDVRGRHETRQFIRVGDPVYENEDLRYWKFKCVADNTITMELYND